MSNKFKVSLAQCRQSGLAEREAPTVKEVSETKDDLTKLVETQKIHAQNVEGERAYFRLLQADTLMLHGKRVSYMTGPTSFDGIDSIRAETVGAASLEATAATIQTAQTRKLVGVETLEMDRGAVTGVSLLGVQRIDSGNGPIENVSELVMSDSGHAGKVRGVKDIFMRRDYPSTLHGLSVLTFEEESVLTGLAEGFVKKLNTQKLVGGVIDTDPLCVQEKLVVQGDSLITDATLAIRAREGLVLSSEHKVVVQGPGIVLPPIESPSFVEHTCLAVESVEAAHVDSKTLKTSAFESANAHVGLAEVDTLTSKLVDADRVEAEAVEVTTCTVDTLQGNTVNAELVKAQTVEAGTVQTACLAAVPGQRVAINAGVSFTGLQGRFVVPFYSVGKVSRAFIFPSSAEQQLMARVWTCEPSEWPFAESKAYAFVKAIEPMGLTGVSHPGVMHLQLCWNTGVLTPVHEKQDAFDSVEQPLNIPFARPSGPCTLFEDRSGQVSSAVQVSRDAPFSLDLIASTTKSVSGNVGLRVVVELVAFE